MRHPARTLALAALVAASCGGSDGGNARDVQPLPNAASLIPVAPAPQPTPTPTPGSEPDESPLPAIPGGGSGGGGTGGSDGSGCGEPLPPPIALMNVKTHGGSGDRTVLDSTPLVGPDAAYCKRIGFTDGRSFCPVRPEGSPERVACEALRVGRASDTGRIGPTWSIDGRPCDGVGDNACVNHPDNQFLVYAYGAGTFRACTAGGACGQLTLP
jgi:hypothetical protein